MRGKRSVDCSTTPQSTLIFVVGHCAEFDEGRAEKGDKQLVLSFRLYGARRVIYMKDDECTREQCQDLLERLLSGSREGDTLVFYYGGHGTKKAFKTIERNWRYKEVVNTIEKRFRGDKVWCLIDCCYSGCFERHIWPTTKSWLCAMSTEATVTAGEDWCMTDTFCKAMKGLYCRPNPASDPVADDDTMNSLRTQDVVELMEDHHAIMKNDWLQASLTGTSIDPMGPFPFLIPKEKLVVRPYQETFGLFHRAADFFGSLFFGTHHFEITTKFNQITDLAHESQTSNVMPVVDHLLWKRQVGIQQGKKVYCKWRGGSPQPGEPYLFPLYLPAMLLSDPSQEEVDVEFSYQGQRWIATVPFSTHVVPASYLWAVMDDYLKAHRILTKHGRYLDATILPGTKVWALYKDDDFVYTGTVLDYHETDWHKVEILDYYEHITGPFLWLEWEDENGNNDIIPKHHCVIVSASSTKPTLEELRRQASQDLPAISPREAILKHMETLDKRLILDTPQDISCLWDGIWHPARTSNQMPSCETLREHLHFEDCKGNYFVVYWTQEDSQSLLPEKLIKWASN